MANILLVDDSRDILEVMQDILEMEGHKVRGVIGKAQLLSELNSYAPDIIILDILLIGDDGRDICKALKTNEATKHIPVLLMSATPGLLQDHEKYGAEDTIAKPFHLADIINKVSKTIKILPLIFINFHRVSDNIIHNL